MKTALIKMFGFFSDDLFDVEMNAVEASLRSTCGMWDITIDCEIFFTSLYKEQRIM